MSMFGENRTANPGNRFDFDLGFGNQGGLLVDVIQGGSGTAVFQSNARDYLLTSGGITTNDVAEIAGHYPVPYTPGSGQEIDITGTMNAADKAGTMSVFLRSTVTGTTTLETVAQASWLANATGMDWKDSQIFRMTFQSLRVGTIQYWMVTSGVPVLVAEIDNDNERATGYWQYASNRPYWHVYSDATNTIIEFGYGDDKNGIGFRYVCSSLHADATARAICATVKSQGGPALLDMPGVPWTTPRITAVTVSTTLIPIVSVRVAALYNSIANYGLVIPTSFTMDTNNPIDYVITLNPTLTGPSWVATNATYNGVEYDVTATAITGGYDIYVDSLSAGTNSVIGADVALGRVIMALGTAGAQDILTISAIRTGASNASVRAYIHGKEIR